MNCGARKARLLLKEGKAKIISHHPFGIQLIVPTGEAKQTYYKGKYLTGENLYKLSWLMNKDWRVKRILKGLLKRPTSLEKALENLIDKYSLPYEYVGDGQFSIGGKCPDFIHTKKNIVIEVRPKKMCRYWSNCTPEEYERQRIDHFAKHSWKCVVVWQEDFINENNVLEKINNTEL